MMFWESFQVTAVAVGQIFILAAIGYILLKKGFFNSQGMDALSRLVMDVTLPILIFCQLIRDFSFQLYPNWWIFPLISVAISLLGLGLAALFSGVIKGEQHKMQFLCLSAFQNSGFLPLALVAALFLPDKKDILFIYLFLFLLGFNLIIFSLGVYLLSFHKDKKFELGSLFSAPVVATSLTLILIFLGWSRFIPDALLRPLNMVGECTLPLAMLVVGGNLAQISLARIDKPAMSLMVLIKLLMMPLLGLLVCIYFKLPEMLSILVILQLAMPPATTPSVILRHYKREDLLVSQGIFVGHILSVITIPVFLSLYFAQVMLK